MRRLFNPVVFCLACLSCGDLTAPVPTPKEISVAAGVVDVTRVLAEGGIYKSFEKGDAISVFAWTGDSVDGALAAGQTVINNIVNRYEGASEWTPDTRMFWAESEDGTPLLHAFAAVYPETDVRLPGKLQGNYTAAEGRVEDVLVARVDGQVPTTEPVELTFDHVMACIEVNLILRDEFSDIDPASVHVTVEAAADAVVDYIEAVSEAVGATDDYRLASSADGLKHTAVLPAQTLPMNIVVHLGDVVRTLRRDGLDLVLESGRRATINLAVGKDFVELSGISAGPWINGGSGNLDAEEVSE